MLHLYFCKLLNTKSWDLESMLQNKSIATRCAEGYNSSEFIPAESLSYLGEGEHFLSTP